MATPLKLQQDLAKEMEDIAKDMLFDNPLGEKSKLKGYVQRLPKIFDDSMDEEEEYDPYPFALIRMEKGTSNFESKVVTVNIIIGIYDNSNDNQGHIAIMNIIDRFEERFLQKPTLNEFCINEEMSFALDDESTSPYYLGAITTTWNVPKINRKDDRFA